MKKSKGKKILLIVFIIFILIQFFRIDKTVPKVEAAKDFIALNSPSDDVKTLLKSACYDCHSYESRYPWYSEIAPVSWWTKHHVNEGREELNFSIWGDYSAKKADHKLEECVEEMEEGEMPLKAYTITHGDAKLSDQQKEVLETFFNGLRDFSSDDEEREHHPQ